MESKKRLQNIEILNYNPHNLNLDTFTLFAECDLVNINFKNVNLTKEEYDVYALQFGEDIYVGSSRILKTRIKTHYYSLKAGKHHSQRVQTAFNNCGTFKVFILMRCNEDMPFAEQMIIRLLNPSLNTTPPKGHNELYNSIIWTANRIK